MSARQQPHEQADGHPGKTPQENDAQAELNTAAQIIDLNRARLHMALGAVAVQDLSAAIFRAKNKFRLELAAARVRPAPDPASPITKADALIASMSETLAQMEHTKRELGLAGDQLAIEQELGR